MRALALDIGSKTIGVAVSDLLNLTAQGVETINRTSIKHDLKRLSELINQYDVSTFVIGLPKSLNGREGYSCELVRKFAAKLSIEFPEIKQYFWDERFSTVVAIRNLIAADVRRKDRKKVVDKLAAVNILQGWLDSQRN